MNAGTYILRSLWFHRRTHRGVWLGAAVATAVLIGALAVGDSVRYSLRAHALARLGDTDVAMISADRFFRDDLAGRMSERLGAPAAAVLQLDGVAGEPARRANDVQVLGVDEAFWTIGGARPKRGQEPFSAGAEGTEAERAGKKAPDPFFNGSDDDAVVLNRRLAEQIGAAVGDEVLLRFNKPSLLPREAPMSLAEGYAVGRRVKVVAIADDADFGRFGLRANQIAPYNAFVPRAWLQRQVELAGRANVLLVGSGATPTTVALAADAALRKEWSPADAELEVREVVQTAPRGSGWAPSPRLSDNPPLPGGAVSKSQTELRTGRIFLDAPVVAVTRGTDPPPTGLLTYFVNRVALGEKSSPYAMVAGIGRLDGRGPGPLAPYLPADLADDEIVLNGWLAEDLGAKAGDEVALTYYVLGPARRLIERSSTFTVRGVLPMPADPSSDGQDSSASVLPKSEIRNRESVPEAGAGSAVPGNVQDSADHHSVYVPDPTMMPDFPGVADAERCDQWKPGLPFEPGRIRPKDQAYWEKHRGAPKAFVTLSAAQRMWSNRFGELTSLRWPAAKMSPSSLRARFKAGLDPGEVGLFFLPVREQALAASRESMQEMGGFAGLFGGLSSFLIIAAVLLTALLFVLGIQQRSEEVGVLLATGVRRKQVRRWLLIEGGLLAAIGAIVGSPLALAYTRVMLAGLARVWSGAVAGSIIFFHVEALSVVAGAAGTVLVAMAAMWLVLWRQARSPARVLLAGPSAGEGAFRLRRRQRLWGAVILVVGAAGAAALIATFWSAGRGGGAVAAFFGAGSLLLIATLGGAAAVLSAAGGGGTRPPTFAGLSIRNGARRSGRSVATVALLACGTFLVVAVGANRLDPAAGAGRKDSGTGGFKLIADLAIPVYQDLSTEAGRKAFKLPAEAMTGATFVPIRVGRGDDASCLNLNRAQQPRLLAADPAALTGRFRFTKAADDLDLSRGWELLNDEQRHFITEDTENAEKRKADGRRRIDGEAAGRSDKALPESPLPSSAPSVPSVMNVASGGSGVTVVSAIGDVDTVQWGLGRSVGDTLDYTDERGRAFQIRIVATIGGSILQGSLIVDEDAYQHRYPSASGYEMFLIDCPAERVGEVSDALSWAGADVGMSVVPAQRRLAEFARVQNSYLSIFQALGGLGLVLGSVGLGVVVMRNVLERRGELAMLRAMGFTRRRVLHLLMAEHAWLLAMGLAGGTIAGVAAVVPALRSPGAEIPYLSLSATVLGVLASGLVWIALAAWAALRGDVLPALRNE